MKKLKIGITGYGKMGRIRERSFLSSDEVSLISIFDLKGDVVGKETITLELLSKVLLIKFIAWRHASHSGLLSLSIIAALMPSKSHFA